MIYSKVQFKSIKLHVLDVKMLVCLVVFVSVVVFFVLLYSVYRYVKKAMMHCAQDKFPQRDNKVEP